MSKRIIAFPGSETGLDGELSAHFGHTPAFTAIHYDDEMKKVDKIESIRNPPHNQGGCMQPVMMLKDYGVTDIVLGGIGYRPLMGFNQVGIYTYRGIPGKTIKDNFEKFKSNELEKLTESTCNHH